MKNKAAIFDIDGVLTKGFAIQHFWDYLAEKGVINKKLLLKSKNIFDSFTRGENTYGEMARKCVEYIAMSFKGVEQEKIRRMSREFFQNHKIETFGYTIPLMKFLKSREMKLIAISGSNIEFAENHKGLLGMDEVYGTEFEVKNGIYTGLVISNLALAEEKRKVVESIPAEKIIGFGDTDQDIPILESVKIPIAMNPAKSWKERLKK